MSLDSTSKFLRAKLALAGLLIVAFLRTESAQSETMSLDDLSFSVSNVPSGATGGILSGRWGTWNSVTSTFIQDVTAALNAGYVDLSGPELSITLNQTLNLGQTSGAVSGVYAPGTSLAVAIFTNGSADAQSINWSSATFGVVLTDSSWITPTFANNANPVSYLFSELTVARLGSFNFNSGNEQLGLALIPEPSTATLLIAALSGLFLRRRRK